MTESESGERLADLDEGVPTFREAREYARGRLDVDHRDVHPFAGVIEDEDLRHVLAFLAETYDPSREDIEAGMPRSFEDTEFYQRAVRKYGTDRLSDAVSEGDVTQTAFFSGVPSYKSDVSGLHAVNQLADWLIHSEQSKLIYLAALMGRGKTDLSLLMLEVINDHYQRLERSVGDEVDVPEPEFAANFHARASGETHIEEIHDYPRLLEWAERGSSDDVRWFIFDEASTELTAQSGANAQKVAERFAPFVKKMRKRGVDMVVIGHDKGDVHPAIRSLADFVDKKDLKTASFYAGISSREPVGHLFDLSGLPPTSWEFDTDDTATWSWGDEDETSEPEGMTDSEFKKEVSERAARVWLQTPDDVTQADVAEAISHGAVSISHATVSRYADKIETRNRNAKATEKV